MPNPPQDFIEEVTKETAKKFDKLSHYVELQIGPQWRDWFRSFQTKVFTLFRHSLENSVHSAYTRGQEDVIEKVREWAESREFMSDHKYDEGTISKLLDLLTKLKDIKGKE